jgi:DNA-binding transcriptional ArsR family regulator
VEGRWLAVAMVVASSFAVVLFDVDRTRKFDGRQTMSEKTAGPGVDVELVAAPEGARSDPATAVPIPDVTTLLQALADPVRIDIVRRLGECADARTCGSFDLPVTKSTLSHHFKVLHQAGIIQGRYEGTRKLISLRRADLDAVYPGLLDSILRAAAARPSAAAPSPS